jgi:hypothetical protein
VGDRASGDHAWGDHAWGDHPWGHEPRSTPVYRYLEDAGLLDAAVPALIPDRAASG